jgi:HEAT repeat protein
MFAIDLGTMYPEYALGLFRELICDSSTEIRLIARHELMAYSINGLESATLALVMALNHSNPKVRGTAVYSIAELGLLINNHSLSRLIVDRDGYVREAAVYYLDRVKTQIAPKLFEKLIHKAQHDKVSQVRNIAIKATRKNKNE